VSCSIGHRHDFGRHQGLPALRQVQARLRDSRSARQSALFAAGQDSGDILVDRGFSLRRADAPRGFPAALDELSDVADHCTVCHKCESPCPVDIDFGDVTMAMRDLLRRMGKKRFNPGTAASMFFLNATNPRTIKLARKVMIDWGYKAQRAANRALKTSPRRRRGVRRSPKGSRRSGSRSCTRQQAHARRPAKRTARALLDIEDRNYVPIIRDPRATTAESEAVFYFPGCGSSGCSAGRLATRPVVARRRPDSPAAGLSVLRLSAAERESSTKRKRSSPTTACCSTVSPTPELSRHQDGGGELRHVLRSASGLRV